eukprot:Rhum_TRINITY_DN14147_c4_g1::Rhum_TRINITY_DN14147_c4_g1_i1::g.71671::m.71671
MGGNKVTHPLCSPLTRPPLKETKQEVKKKNTSVPQYFFLFFFFFFVCHNNASALSPSSPFPLFSSHVSLLVLFFLMYSFFFVCVCVFFLLLPLLPPALRHPSCQDGIEPARWQGAVSRKLRKVLHDVLVVRLKGTTSDLQKLRVPPQTLHRHVTRVPHAAEHLDGRVRNLLADRRGEQLRRVRADPVLRRGAHGAGHRVRQGLGGLRLREALRHVLLDLPEVADRLAERPALLRVVEHDLDAALGDADGHGRKRQPLQLQVAHHAQHAASFLAEAVRDGHLAVREEELAHRRPTHAALVDLAAVAEALHAPLHEESRHLALYLGVDDVHVRVRAVRDPRLAAVQHVVVALALRGRLHAEHVSARRRLAHAHGADHLAGHRLLEEAGALLVVGGVEEVVHKEHGVGEVCKREARVVLAQLVVDDDGGGRVEADAAVRLGHGDAHHAELTQLLEELDVEVARHVELARLRLDTLAGELGHGVAQHSVLLRGVQQEVHARQAHVAGTRPPRNLGTGTLHFFPSFFF